MGGQCEYELPGSSTSGHVGTERKHCDVTGAQGTKPGGTQGH